MTAVATVATVSQEMRVADLIQLLSTIDPERMVVLQTDSEGNGYSPLWCVDSNAAYMAVGHSGEVKPQTLSEDQLAHGYDPVDDVADHDATPCVVLVPAS